MQVENEALVRPRAGRREWIGLAVIALPCLVYAMDLTVLYLAVPSLARDLQPSSAQLLWITDIYGFLIAGSLITMGTLGDRVGRRRILLIGAAAFAVASLLAAFSTTAEMLIVARALLGIAGATLAPSTLSLIRNMFLDPRQRTIAIGVWISSFSAGGAIGPLFGGVLLEFFWWGSVFLLGVPVMVLLLAVGPRLLPEFRDPTAGRLDLIGAALSLTSLLAVIYGLKLIAQDGMGAVPAASLVVGLILGSAFVRRQSTVEHPLIDLGLFRVRAFSVSLTAYTLGIFTMFGMFLFTTQYLQLVLGLSPLEAGIWTVPEGVAFIVGSMATPAIARRIRPAHLMAGGLVVAAGALAVLTQVQPDAGLALIVGASVVMSVGLAPMFTLGTDLIIGSAPPERAGAASGISETGAELGGALGIAVLGTLGTAVYRNEIVDAIPTGVPSGVADAARDTLGTAEAVAADLPNGLGVSLLDAARDAFTQALQVTAAIGTVIVLGLAILIATMLGRSQKEPDSEAGVDLGVVESVPAESSSLT